MTHTTGRSMKTGEGRKLIAHPGWFAKKQVKRDQSGRKMTQKGAIHAKNPAKQPERFLSTNHERHLLRRIAREGNK